MLLQIRLHFASCVPETQFCTSPFNDVISKYYFIIKYRITDLKIIRLKAMFFMIIDRGENTNFEECMIFTLIQGE